MRRARQSAEPIARACGVTHEIEPTLHERRVGVLSGTRTSPNNDLWNSTICRWESGELEYALPGAESFIDIRNRVLPAWERLTRHYNGKTWILVVHGVVIRVLMISLLPEFQPFGWHSIGITNLAVNELRWDFGRWVAVRLNQVVAHVL
jgi:probable phosphoglycerate mutase